MSCPGAQEACNDDGCACGYTGALCGECASGYFREWTSDGACSLCTQSKNFGPTVVLGLLFCACVAATVIFGSKKLKQKFPKMKSLLKLVAIKFKTLFFAAQVASVI